MIQRAFDIRNESELSWMISAANYGSGLLNAEKNGNYKTVFWQAYLSRFSRAEAEIIIAMLREKIPNAKIAGMSLYGDSFVGLNNDKFIRFNICMFEKSDVFVFEYDSEKMSEEEIIALFRKRLSETPNVKGVQIIAAGMTFPISNIIEKLSEGFDSIHFFGTMANINSSDLSSSAPYAFSSNIINSGFVAVIFSGESLKIYTESLFSWKPIGKHMVVHTESIKERKEWEKSNMYKNGDSIENSIGDTIVKTIDGIPATEIYKKYLDVEPDSHFISNICEFPLVAERNGNLVARVPFGYNSKGEINLMGDLFDGEKIRFTYGKTDDILRRSFKSSVKMSIFNPQAIFLFVCANRAIFMKSRAFEEIDFYRKINSNSLYCHGFCEIHKFNGTGGVFNSQLVTIGLREDIDCKKNILDWNDSAAILEKFPISFSIGNADSEKSSATYKENPQYFIALKNAFDKAQRVGKDGEATAKAKFQKRNFDEMLTNLTNEKFKPQNNSSASIPLSDRLVTFLEATTNDLEKATKAANAANKAKSDFLSRMSHEIRTPINAVLGFDEMIFRETNEAHIKNYAHNIQASGRALLTIINDILDFSKIEAGKMEIIAAPYDLRQMIADLNSMIEERARKKGLKFIIDVDENIPHKLFGDNVRIQQCVVNILTNAVKYTKQGSVMLSIGAEMVEFKDEIELCFSVHDTGIGIKTEDLKNLFSPFERIEEKRNHTIEGTGLGLSIVNGLLKNMGSRLYVTSKYGVGSTFSFSVNQKVREWEKIGTKEESIHALNLETEIYSETFQAPDANILVIDDTQMNLLVFKGLLKSTRCQIDTANSADEGLDLTRQKKYDIIFADHLMPQKDGIAFLRELRGEKSNANCKTVCIVLTANAVSGARKMYIEAGFGAYLSKPVVPKNLEEMIAKHLPREKLIHKGDPNFIETAKVKWDGIERRKSRGSYAAAALFSEFFGLDIESGVKNCGSIETFKIALSNFCDAICETSHIIEDALEKRDWDNFTVKVHALKSSARLIGADELSATAKNLEESGDALRNDENAIAQEKIAADTEKLLSLYRSYSSRLFALLHSNEIDANSAKCEKKAELSDADFFEYLNALKEMLLAYDLKTADEIVSEIEKHSVKKSHINEYSALKKAVVNVDIAEAARLIDEICGN